MAFTVSVMRVVPHRSFRSRRHCFQGSHSRLAPRADTRMGKIGGSLTGGELLCLLAGPPT